MGTYVKDGNSCIGCGSLLDFPYNCYNCKNLKSNIEIIKVIKDQKLKSSNSKYAKCNHDYVKLKMGTTTEYMQCKNCGDMLI